MSTLKLVMEVVSTIVIPVIALIVGYMGIRTWQIDKIISVYSKIETAAENINKINLRNGDINIKDFTELCFKLLDQLEVFAILVNKQYILVGKEFKNQLFNDFIKDIYENKSIQVMIKEKRKLKPNKYLHLEKLYKKWNKK